MKINFEIPDNEIRAFESKLESTITRVGNRTKRAAREMGEEILQMSLEQVPRDTDTLAQSAFTEVTRRRDTSRSYYAYQAVIGYGNPANDPINPKNKRHASSYMVAVHEDLDVLHIIGKAKFLEDPVEEYGKSKLRDQAAYYWKTAIQESES